MEPIFALLIIGLLAAGLAAYAVYDAVRSRAAPPVTFGLDGPQLHPVGVDHVHCIITLGIGSPGDIEHLITFGLDSQAIAPTVGGGVLQPLVLAHAGRRY